MQRPIEHHRPVRPTSGHEKVLNLVKAVPHAGHRQGETVCCAGVTEHGEWRRQYPVHFRRLDSQFKRWDWIEYDWISPGSGDTRWESRRVQEDTIVVRGKLTRSKHAKLLNPLVLPSMAAAAALGRSLVLIRPQKTRFRHKAKTQKTIDEEKRRYQAAAAQLSMMDAELSALEPCPYAFKFQYETEDGIPHEMACEDWETTAMFNKWQRIMGAQPALDQMSVTFNERYPEAGMAFAMGTHSRHPDQWLLVGVLRLDHDPQSGFAL